MLPSQINHCKTYSERLKKERRINDIKNSIKRVFVNAKVLR